MSGPHPPPGSRHPPEPLDPVLLALFRERLVQVTGRRIVAGVDPRASLRGA